MTQDKSSNSNPQPESIKSHKEKASQDADQPWWSEVIKTLVLSIFLALGIRVLVAEARFIPTPSMESTLMVDDRLLVDKVTYRFAAPARGDIIVFEMTEDLQEKYGVKDAFIKRIIGLPGDQVAISNYRVYVNGQPLSEPYLEPSILTRVESCNDPNAFLSKPQIIPANSYLVLGDNRDNSSDGRCWGVVHRDRIIGRAAILFWPPNRMRLISGSGGN
jgi:signal peptidase I